MSSAAGISLQPVAFCPHHSGEKSPFPCASAFARSGASATDASGNSATNTRLVQVIALTAPTITSQQKLGSGAFEVTFTGPSGQPYQLLSSPSVDSPMGSWTSLTSGVFGEIPVIYTDNTATTDALRFYRVVSP